ncbi:type I glyceraldehyde-3-phosphate dehydrogenase [Patescibacteria group bacterium]|nr:type I glyceraldehyde-3-phosphate dehydrogenase [Patescibacteria group bacterium]
MIKVAINGFGRIGRLAFRAWHAKYKDKIDIVAINTSGSMPASSWAHLIKYDTIYKEFPGKISSKDEKKPGEATDEDPRIGTIIVGDKEIPILAQREPSKLPWSKYQVEVVIESTGVFRTPEQATAHIKAGAKRVVISAPTKEEDGSEVGTYVLGVNKYEGKEKIISNASCTTNCVAPIAAILHSKFGIKKATMTSVHGYTANQNLQDNSHKDLRRARAAAQNIIPTTTGAAEATIKAIPELSGLFDGIAIRVPVAVGSIADLVCLLKQRVTVDQVNQAFKEAENKAHWKGIVATIEEPIVSSDIVGRSESAIIDLAFTQVVDGDLVKVLAWYDNELGYSFRLVEQVIQVGKTINSG